jgi:hypothetical protein
LSDFADLFDELVRVHLVARRVWNIFRGRVL